MNSFKPGDRVVSTFSAVCLKCWFCLHGYTNRCVHGMAFGTQQLDGGQAEYVRVPMADGTLQEAPETLSDELLIMMCDIFPTGYYGATRAIQYFPRIDDSQPITNGNASTARASDEPRPQYLHEAVFVILGCGPVGLCAILTAKSKGVRTVYCVDSVDDRLAEAKKLGGIPLKLGQDDIEGTISKATDGRGCDAVVEVVGNKAALRSAFELLRQCGVLSSIGFHQSDLPFTGLECYQKNLNVNFGRAPVRSVFRESLEYLAINKEELKTFVSHTLPLADAAKGYSMFEQHQARKVAFIP